MASSPDRPRAAIALLVLLFVVTRLFLFTGFPFNPNSLDIGMQMLDPVDLRQDLLRSLLYQHNQPPLFNAYVGVVLAATGDRETATRVFSLLYAAIGLFLVLGIHSLALALGASRLWAFASAALFVFWPPNTWSHHFLHPPAERWVSYDYPLTAVLLFMALALVRFRDKGRASWLVLFLLASVAAVLTRSMFHLLFWLVPTAVLALLMTLPAARRKDPGSVRMVLAASVLALGLGAGLYAKNLRLCGWFSGSSFQGMNLASLTLFIPTDDIVREVEGGTVTPLALIPRFSTPEVYLGYYGEDRRTGIRVLDEPVKSTGHPNFNHFIIPRASREYQRNTLALVRAHPLEALRAVANGIYIFFGFAPNQYLWPLERASWGFWKVDLPTLKPSGALWPLRYIVGPALFALLYLSVIVLPCRAGRDPALLFISFALLYVFALSLLELGNNSVFRQQVDPLLFAASALLLTRLWSLLKTSRHRTLDSRFKYPVPG